MLGPTTLSAVEFFLRRGYKLPTAFSESYKVFVPKNDDNVDKDLRDVSRRLSELRPFDMKNTDNKIMCSVCNWLFADLLRHQASPLQRGLFEAVSLRKTFSTSMLQRLLVAFVDMLVFCLP